MEGQLTARANSEEAPQTSPPETPKHGWGPPIVVALTLLPTNLQLGWIVDGYYYDS